MDYPTPMTAEEVRSAATREAEWARSERRRLDREADFRERLAAAPSRQVRRRMMRKERWLRVLD